MKVGILTGGGDCPGLNAVIRAIVRKGILHYQDEFTGIYNGWKGLMDKDTGALTLDHTSGLLVRGGTILGTSRFNPYKTAKGEDIIRDNYRVLGLDALIVIGGNDTLSVALKLYQSGINIVGIPKTIDNDVNGTDVTFGFHTAVEIATEAIDRLHSTAESHHRVIVCEVMGREAGWIAVYSGIAGGADIILIPEVPFDLKEISALIKKRHERGKTFSIVVVAEGAQPKSMFQNLFHKPKEVDAFGHEHYGGIANTIAKQIESMTGYETRTTILGHVQRGGVPNAFDRILATRFGVHSIDMVHQKEYGKITALKSDQIIAYDLAQAVSTQRKVPPELYDVAKIFFG